MTISLTINNIVFPFSIVFQTKPQESAVNTKGLILTICWKCMPDALEGQATSNLHCMVVGHTFGCYR